jgi:hypothetical protein
MTAALAVEDSGTGQKPQYRASGWIVLNTWTKGHRVLPTKKSAQAIVDQWPDRMRMMPMIGKFDVDEKFVNLMCDMLA